MQISVKHRQIVIGIILYSFTRHIKRIIVSPLYLLSSLIAL